MAAAAMRASWLFLAAAMIVGCSVSGALAAADRSDLDFKTELQQRQDFDADDFVFKFKKTSDKTPFGNLRPMFVDFNAALATLPGDGASQNLVTVGPCAINQPRNLPRATQISHVTEGTGPSLLAYLLVITYGICELLRCNCGFWPAAVHLCWIPN